jgi:hypothetical protein
MSRTPEQRAADEALTVAVEAVWAAYIDDPDRGVLTDFVVIGARAGFDEDGDRWTSVGTFTRDNAVPLHVQLGLLEYRGTRIRAIVNDPD